MQVLNLKADMQAIRLYKPQQAVSYGDAKGRNIPSKSDLKWGAHRGALSRCSTMQPSRPQLPKEKGKTHE